MKGKPAIACENIWSLNCMNNFPESLLLPGERIDDLQLCNLRIIQSPDSFRFGMDAVLLSDFARVRPGSNVCDLGTGTGILPLLLYGRAGNLQCDAVEIQPDAAERAQRSMVLNGLENSIRVHCGDLRNIRSILPHAKYDLVICNPPYYPPRSGAVSDDPALRKARAETECTLEDVCRAASYLLRWGGSFCFVHKPERLTDLLCTLRQVAIEPKRLRFVCKTANSAPSLLLLEGRRGGNPGLCIEPPLILQNPDGTPTPEVDAIYFRSP